MRWTLFRARSSSTATSPARRKRRGFRPVLERLEDRLAPAFFNWVLNGDGDFATAANWRDQANNAGVPSSGDDALINNSAITVTVSSSQTLNTLSSTARLAVAGGTFSLANVGQGSSVGQLVLNSGATFQVSGGTTSLTNGGTINGTFLTQPGATLGFTGGTFTVNSSSLFSGTGQFQINGQSVTVNFTSAFTAPRNLELARGTLGGTGTITVSGTTMTWSGGTMTDKGITEILQGASLNITGSAFKYVTGERIVNIAGSATWTGVGELDGSPGSLINNSGTFTIQNDAPFANGAAGARVILNNLGTLTKTGTNGTTTFNDNVLNNSGTVNVQSGTLVLAGGGTNTGTFNVLPGATVSFQSDDFFQQGYNLNAGSVLSGAGLYRQAGGFSSLSVNANLSVQNFDLTDGTLKGAGALTITSTFNWSGATMTGTGTTTVPANAVLNISGSANKLLTGGRILINNGTATWTGAGELDGSPGSTINNAGTFTIQTDAPFANGAAGARMIFNNSGTLTKTGTTGTTVFVDNQLNNTGTVNVASGGLSLNGGGTSTGTFSVSANATLSFGVAAYTMNSGTSTTGTGLYRLDSGTLQVNGNIAPTKLTLLGGNLAGPGSVTVSGMLSWMGGAMVGSGTTVVQATATLAISGGDIKTIDGRTLSSAGTGTYSGTGVLFAGNSAVFTNSGTFTLQNDEPISSFGNAGTILNTGTFTKTSAAGSGVSLIGPIFNNPGMVAVSSGILQLNTGGTATGAFNVAASSALSFTNGLYTLSPGASLTGSGQFRVEGATLTVNTDVSPANLFQTSGRVEGTGNVVISTLLDWSGGTMTGTGQTTVQPGGTLTLAGGGSRTLDGRAFFNAGTGAYSGTGDFSIGASAVFTNSGTFNVQNDEVFFTFGSQGVIVNSGTWNKASPAGTGTSRMDTLFNNLAGATVNVNSGVLQVIGGGSSSGAFNIAATNTIRFTSIYTFGANASVTGAGFARIAGGVVSVNANVTAANFALDTGTLSGGGTLTITGSFDWTGGTIADPTGGFNLSAGATLTIRGNLDKSLDGRTLNLAGAAIWSDSGNINVFSSGTANVQNSGTFTIQNDKSLTGNGTLNNAGTLSKSAGIGTSIISPGIVVNNNGGTVQVQVGTLSIGSYTQNAGTTTVSAGATLTTASTATINIGGGTLSGPGSVNGNVSNSGTVTPGTSPGILTINGNYTQTQFGTLDVELGGTNGGSQHDRLVVTGTANLNGTLVVKLINNFTPTQSNSFRILTFANRTGDFAQGSGLNVSANLHLDPFFDATGLTLITNQPNPGVIAFNPALVTVPENGGTVTLTLVRTGGTVGQAGVSFTTNQGPAVAGSDYAAATGAISFNEGETTKTITISILSDAVLEGNETFTVTLFNPTGGAALGTNTTATVTIKDDDGTQNQRFIATVYLELLKRPVDSFGLGFWTSFLGQAGNTRQSMVRQLENSDEYRAVVVREQYPTLLRRPADDGGVSFFVGLMRGGATVEQVQAKLAGSGEYFRTQGNNDPNLFLDALFRDALGRAVDPGARSFFTPRVQAGQLESVASDIYGSDEFKDVLVKNLYQRYLRRPADSGGLSFFVTQLRQGGRDEDVVAGLVGSDEYFARV